MSRSLAAVLIASSIVAGGCLADRTDPLRPSGPLDLPSGNPAPSSGPVASSAASAPPLSADPTSGPTPPANLKRSATAELDGVRLTIELERNPMPAGEPTWITTTIKNTGHDAVIYYPCGEATVVAATIADLPWRPGASLPNPAMAWKELLTDGQGLRDSARRVLFLPDGQDGASSGCGDIGHVATIAPGATFRERARWDGLTFRRLNPPPNASIDLVGSFSFDRGDPAVEHPPENRSLVEVHLDTWIAGLPEDFLDPAEAVDIALTDPRLTSLLATHDLRNGNEGVLVFDPKTGVYQIGMLESGSGLVSPAHLMLVDARTGVIVGFVERDWNYQVDGFP